MLDNYKPAHFPRHQSSIPFQSSPLKLMLLVEPQLASFWLKLVGNVSDTAFFCVLKYLLMLLRGWWRSLSSWRRLIHHWPRLPLYDWNLPRQNGESPLVCRRLCLSEITAVPLSVCTLIPSGGELFLCLGLCTPVTLIPTAMQLIIYPLQK